MYVRARLNGPRVGFGAEVTYSEPTEPPNNTMNPTAGGGRPHAAHVGHSPAAGYGER